MFISLIPKYVLGFAAQELLNSLPEHILYALNGRYERGLMLALERAVTPYNDRSQPWRTNLFQVRSSNPYQPPFSYLVDLDQLTCECPDFDNGFHCKHLIAAQITERARRMLEPSRSG